MMGAKNPTFTTTFGPNLLQLPNDCTYVHCPNEEDRSTVDDSWSEEASSRGVRFATVHEHSLDSFDVTVHGQTSLHQTRSEASIVDLIRRISGPIYLDVTGLSHATWAPILRGLVLAGTQHKLAYTEPASYSRRHDLAGGFLYDLSESIQGIAPIPQFARLRPVPDADSHLVALLGFEGARLVNILRDLETPEQSIATVLGLPGFAWNHPFEALEGNMTALDAGAVAQRMRYASAYCPFEAFYHIQDAARLSGKAWTRIAPIGTKPHAIGAVLYALANPRSTELLYDHPVRAQKRSIGAGRTHLYDTGEFVATAMYNGTLR